MKVIRDCDWKLIGYRSKDFVTGKSVFLFQHRRYGDVLALNGAKFIIVGLNMVLFFDGDAKEEKISVSKRREAELVRKFPSLLGVLHKTFDFSKWLSVINTLTPTT